MIKHQIEALAEAGVTDIVLAVNYRPEVMEAHLKEVIRSPLLFPAPLRFPPAGAINPLPCCATYQSCFWSGPNLLLDRMLTFVACI